jgi:hypothetical protein
MSPTWPPIEISVIGGVTPSMGHLLQALSQAFPDISKSEICVFRRARHACQWTLLYCPVDGAVSNSAAKKKASQKHLGQAPFNIRDGDSLCVFSCKDIDAKLLQALRQLDVGLSSIVNPDLLSWEISTQQDLSARKRKADNEQRKKDLAKDKKSVISRSPNASATRGVKVNKARVEQALVIKMDYL